MRKQRCSLWGWCEHLAGWSFMAALALFAAACSPTGLRLPQSPILSALERKAGLIVYIGNDGNVYTIDQGGGQQRAVTNDAVISPNQGETIHYYQFPTWSPDNNRLAFVGITSLTGEIESVSLYTSKPDGTDRVEAFRGEDDYPFYLYWSPDSDRISFLAAQGTGEGLVLNVVHARGGEVKTLGSSSAFYWSWSPDNQNLLVHSGGAARTDPSASLQLMTVSDGIAKKDLELRPTLFQAPAWSPNGEELLVAAEMEGDQEALYLTDRMGAVKKVLANIIGGTSFGWSPNGKQVAYLTRDAQSEDDTSRVLTILDPERPEKSQSIQDELIVAFFWSPDSRRVAYFIPSLVFPGEEGGQQAQAEPIILLTVKIFNLRSGESTQVAAFQPTRQFINLLPFFDQYQHSVRIWSPDSRNLVMAGVDEEGNEGIYIVEAGANLQPRFLAEGDLAVWSWK